MITCLCVTRGDRLAFLADSIADFNRQTFPDRELLIVHDGDDTADAAVTALLRPSRPASARIQRVPPGRSLGALRNIAVNAARGDWICQWDDDDRYHPMRLALQWDAASAERAAVCYLVDQLHWFRERGLLCWDDWDREPYPVNFVQGTILARRDIMPPYPDLPRGEDTLHTYALMRAAADHGFGIARLRGAGWCYIYSYHGGNVWGAAHHEAISSAKHLPPARLLPRLAPLKARLAEFEPPLPGLHMPLGRSLERMTPDL